MRRLIPLALLAAAAACHRGPAGPRPVPIADPATGGTFLVTLGTDTVAIEQYTRSGNRIEGDILQRQPTTRITHYVLALEPDGRARSVTLRTRKPDGSPLPNAAREATMTFAADTVVTTIVLADSTVTRRNAVRGALPGLGNSYAMWEQAIMTARAARSDSTAIVLLTPGAANPFTLPVMLVGRDSARVWYFGSPIRLTLDRAGHVMTVNGELTTNKVDARRIGPVDIAALGRAFAARDAAGQALGVASPRDTVRATIGGAELWVDYGRPARRGRDVWENGVLGDTLWRTGANDATQFHTSKDIELGGKLVPAGTYTLFTHAARGGYELVVNRQVGQWGTEYHPDRDLLRVTLTESLAPETERFTILITPQGNDGGVLALRWARKELSVPIKVR
ncbi:MAG: DUF2911 domain-containing protein [Gemmatimonadaceae bacterium]